MENSIRILVWFVFIYLTVLIAFSVFVITSLKRKFPRLWEALGSPERWIYLNRTSRENHFFTFLDSKRYLETNDPKFIFQCKATKVGWYGFFIFFVIAIVGLGATIALKKPF